MEPRELILKAEARCQEAFRRMEAIEYIIRKRCWT